MTERSRLVVSAVLAVELLGVASSPASAPVQEIEAMAIESAPEKSDLQRYYEMPNTPCMSSTDAAKQKQCLDIHRNTRIALVNFDFTPEEAAGIAQEMKPGFDRSTGGIFNAQPEVIPATDAAKADALRRRGADNCVKDFVGFAAVAAQETMPEELSEDRFDMVIGLTKAQRCVKEQDKEKKQGGDTVGLAESNIGRYADLLAAKVPATMRWNVVYLGNIVAHEAGHLAGLGHESLLGCTVGPDPNTISLKTVMPGPEVFDLSSYMIGRCLVDEYDIFADGVMGSPGARPGIEAESNQAQIKDLMKPEIKQGATSPEEIVTPAGATVTLQEAVKGGYAALPISTFPPKVVELNHPTQGKTEMPVSDLTIIPRTIETPHGPKISEIDLGFLTHDNNAITLGKLLALGVPNPQWELAFDGKQVVVELKDGNVTVRSKA